MKEIKNTNSVDTNSELFHDLCGIIDEARRHVATYVNVEACLMNWHVGKRIKEDVLFNERAEYGKRIIKNLAIRLTERYGAGWGVEKLRHCVRAAYTFSEDEIVSEERYPCGPILYRTSIKRGLGRQAAKSHSYSSRASVGEPSIKITTHGEKYDLSGRKIE